MKIQTLFGGMLVALWLVSCGGKSDLGTQLDQMGRAAINTALNETFANASDKASQKNAYNAANSARSTTFRDEFANNLGVLDSLVGSCGDNTLTANQTNPTAATAYDTFAGVLADDQLYVYGDQGTCSTYLAVETSVLTGGNGTSVADCGGRSPTMDVMDTTYSLLAAGTAPTSSATVTDGVDVDDVTHSVTSFPFLAPPQ